MRCIELTSYNIYHADGSSEVHTIEIRNGNDPVARFRFQDNHHNSGVWAPSRAVCVKTPSTADDSTYLLLANGALGSGSSGNGNSNILSVLGAFYYISTHNGSTDIVTNADGIAIARFAYEPFGKVNTELTDLDPDRNGVHYGESFMFTGQEFEQETGLYNYKARMYDQETGRFLQPDPVHTENVGFDNWDRYQYANNNPVNFTDPTGESTNFVHMFNKILKNSFNGFNHAMKNWIHGNNRGMKSLSHKFNSSLKGMIGKFNSGLGAIGHKVDHAVKSPLAVALYTARSVGITDEEFLLLYFFASLLGHSATETWFGHNYTGPGNKDPFSKFNNRYSKTSKQIEFFILMKAVLGDRITDEKVLMFLMLIPFLSPEPKSFADGLAQRHDRDVPGDMLGFPDQFFSLKFHARHLKADGNYVGGFFKGMFTPSSGFWKTPLDSIVVGGGGSVLFSGDACLRTFCWVPFVL